MKMFILFACLAAASATTLLRAPSHDSAVIQSHRFGGNFAYRTDEAHAYAAINPIVSTVRKAVGVSYAQGAPIVRSTSVHAPIAAVAAVRAAPIGYAAGYAAAPIAATGYAAGYAAAPLAATGYAAGLGYSGLGYSGLGYNGLGYSGLGYSGLGHHGLGYAGHNAGLYHL